MPKIFVTCPRCRQKLSFNEVSGFRDMLIECPVCSFKAKAGVYVFGGVNSQGDMAGAPTELNLGGSPAPSGRGRLREVATGRIYELKTGKNIIGRKATSGNADIQIEGDMYMSSSHMRIDVVDTNGEFRLIEISSKNIVQLNHTPIKRNDIVLLHPGDVLTLGKTEVVFEIFEDEATQLL